MLRPRLHRPPIHDKKNGGGLWPPGPGLASGGSGGGWAAGGTSPTCRRSGGSGSPANAQISTSADRLALPNPSI